MSGSSGTQEDTGDRGGAVERSIDCAFPRPERSEGPAFHARRGRWGVSAGATQTARRAVRGAALTALAVDLGRAARLAGGAAPRQIPPTARDDKPRNRGGA